MTKLQWPDRSWCLGANLRGAAEARGDSPFLSFGSTGPSYSVAEVDACVDAIAAGFQRLGLTRGENVLLMLPNAPEMVLSWFGANRLGAVEVPVNNEYRGAFLEHVVNTSGAEFMVVSDQLAEAVIASADRLPFLRTLVVVGDLDTVPPSPFDIVPFGELTVAGAPSDPAIEPWELSSVNFTSGTTGPSKGAMMPHANQHLMGSRCAELMALGPGDVYLMPLPLYHVHAQTITYACLVSGAAIHYERRFSATEWLATVRRVGATCFTTLGVMLAFILGQPERADDADNTLRRLWSCPTPPRLIAQFQRRFGVEEIATSYGNTEIGMICMAPYDPARPESVGAIAEDYYEVQLVDEEDRPVAVDEPGELCVRPRIPWILLQGYYGMPERMLEASRNFWFHTGDILKCDEVGSHYFLDRKADRIRRRGENIASLDVEQVLLQHDRIADVAVVAVPGDVEGGEDELKATIVVSGGPAVEPEELWQWSEEHLPAFAVPRYWEFLDALPKTPTEKVQKYRLRELGTINAVDREQRVGMTDESLIQERTR
jgi:crotonobetaine/carnitine-CoA ligase